MRESNKQRLERGAPFDPRLDTAERFHGSSNIGEPLEQVSVLGNAGDAEELRQRNELGIVGADLMGHSEVKGQGQIKRLLATGQ